MKPSGQATSASIQSDRLLVFGFCPFWPDDWQAALAAQSVLICKIRLEMCENRPKGIKDCAPCKNLEPLEPLEHL